MREAVILVICALLAGCKTTERKAKEWAYDNKDKLAGWCADCFPVKPSEVIRGDTVVKMDTITKIDSVRVTVQADCPDGTVVEVECPATKERTIEKHTHTSDTLKIRDTAMEFALTADRDDLRDRLDAMTRSRDQYRKWFWIAMLIVAGYALLRVKRVF